jgi:hypothetical protein
MRHYDDDANILRLHLVKRYIELGYLTTIESLFPFLTKRFIAERAAIDYWRFLRLVRRPYKLTCMEAERLARALDVTEEVFIKLLDNQLDELYAKRKLFKNQK